MFRLAALVPLAFLTNVAGSRAPADSKAVFFARVEELGFICVKEKFEANGWVGHPSQTVCGLSWRGDCRCAWWASRLDAQRPLHRPRDQTRGRTKLLSATFWTIPFQVRYCWTISWNLLRRSRGPTRFCSIASQIGQTAGVPLSSTAICSSMLFAALCRSFGVCLCSSHVAAPLLSACSARAACRFDRTPSFLVCTTGSTWCVCGLATAAGRARAHIQAQKFSEPRPFDPGGLFSACGHVPSHGRFLGSPS